MAPSSSNKRKLDLDFSRDPIIFISPGLPRDVRITVFRQEFHLNSVLLKLHSAYFRTFLGSADKSGKPASAKFRYDYVSVIGGDGDWILETVEKVCDQAATLSSLEQSIVLHLTIGTCYSRRIARSSCKSGDRGFSNPLMCNGQQTVYSTRCRTVDKNHHVGGLLLRPSHSLSNPRCWTDGQSYV